MSTVLLSQKARRRAKLRKESGGATMFIVSITLASLAVMGVFGLTATAADVRAAGHSREGMQARHVAEHAVMDTAAVVGPKTAQIVINTMMGGASRQTTTCKTAKAFNPATREFCAAEACMKLTPVEMDTLLRGVNPALVIGAFFSASSFGPTLPTPYPLDTRLEVELTNPVPIEQAGIANGMLYYQVTATIFAEMKSNAGPMTPPATMVVGRGRITLGPVYPPPGCNRL